MPKVSRGKTGAGAKSDKVPSVQRVGYRQAFAQEWDELGDLIRAFADAQEAESWKGGGDPESYRELELALELAKERLWNHIRIMRRRRDEEDEDEFEKAVKPKTRNKRSVSKRSSRSDNPKTGGTESETGTGDSDLP